MKDFLVNYFGEFLTMVIGGFGGWFFGRKKNDAEVEDVKARTDSIEIENEIKLSNYYKELLDDLKPRYDSQFREFQNACMSKEKLMREKIVLLKEENKILRQHIADRDKRIAELEKIKK